MPLIATLFCHILSLCMPLIATFFVIMKNVVGEEQKTRTKLKFVYVKKTRDSYVIQALELHGAHFQASHCHTWTMTNGMIYIINIIFQLIVLSKPYIYRKNCCDVHSNV